MRNLVALLAAVAFVLGIVSPVIAGDPKPGTNPPKCMPADSPGCSGDPNGTGPHDDGPDDDEGGGND